MAVPARYPGAMLPLLLACALKTAPLPPPPVAAATWTDKVDWAAAEKEAADVLSRYLQVPTVNPPGNETAGAQFLAGILEAEGIPSEIVEFEPGRGSLIARLPGSGAEEPLCLLSHIDVVTSEAHQWPEGKGPLSGTIDEDGTIWGRGALDMKGMGTIELLTLLWLKRLEVPLKRDVILLAVADEEVHNGGARLLASEKWGEIGCSHLVNEGGIGIQDMLFDGQTVYPISVGEKGALWIRMWAEGPSGHGSTPRPGEAPAKLIEAVNALEARKVEYEINPALYQFLANAGEDKGGFSGFVMRRPFLVRRLVKPKLEDNPLTRAAMMNTVHVTGFGGANEPNVVPSQVYALLDCRLLPGTEPEEMLAYIQDIVGDDIRLEVLQSFAGNLSPWEDDPFYQALARQVAAPGAVAGPVVSVGFTDSIFFRPLGVRAYGFVPFAVTEEEMGSFHGVGERVSTENLGRGLRALLGAVIEVSAAKP